MFKYPSPYTVTSNFRAIVKMECQIHETKHKIFILSSLLTHHTFLINTLSHRCQTQWPVRYIQPCAHLTISDLAYSHNLHSTYPFCERMLCK